MPFFEAAPFHDWSRFELAGLYSIVVATMCLVYGRKVADSHPSLARVAMGVSIFLSIFAFVFLLWMILQYVILMN